MSSHSTVMEQPQPQSRPGTPSEMPGTPTSTTTSLSALSTTATKDGQRGQPPPSAFPRGHYHNSSTNSLEAERADRIARMEGLSSVSTLGGAGLPGSPSHASTQTTPTSSGFPAGVLAQANAAGLTPAYFDAAGQPVAVTKMSTVGTASATESVGGRTTTETGIGEDHDMGDADAEEDMASTDTNYRETEADSVSGYFGDRGGGGDIDPMDEDLSNRSVSGFEDHMSDDGSASLVGFGEGAGSTVSGPIYHRRLPPQQVGPSGSPAGVRGLERSASGLSESAGTITARRDTVRGPTSLDGGGGGGGVETPVSTSSAALERRKARMVDGVATDGAGVESVPPRGADDDPYVDTTTRGPVPVRANTSAIRETQQPHSHQQQAQARAGLEAAERIVRERLGDGEARVGVSVLGSPKGDGELGRFYFEDQK